MAKKTYDQYPVVYVKFLDHYITELVGGKISEIKKFKPLILEVVGFVAFDNKEYFILVLGLETGEGRKGRQIHERISTISILKSTVIDLVHFSGPEFKL